MMQKPDRRWLPVALALMTVIAMLAFFLRSLATRSFPQHRGQLKVAGLRAPVEILRSQQGVPHIYAQSEHDLFLAQGYVHAQDRFWQMDFFRHVGRGRLSEMFGASQLETDIFLQTLGWERIAQQEFEQLDPSTRQVLTAYSQGINAYLEAHRPGQISLEYIILGILSPDYKIQPWHPIDTLAWAKSMAWDLGGNLDGEINRAILLDQIPPEQVAQLYPPYPSHHPIISGEGSGQTDLPYAPTRVDIASLHLASDLRQRLAALPVLQLASLQGIGSNNWVIGPELTLSGSPILANDTHLGIQMPSIWYENGLHCQPISAHCRLQVAGFSFAGAPGVVIGHNDRIAWGVTNADPDVQDLFIEQLDPARPNQYLYQGEWEPMELIEQQITVVGQEPVTITVRRTRHGPLITDSYGPLEDLSHNRTLGAPENYALALRWTALEPSTLVTAILQLNRAQNWGEFRQALAGWDVPAQNFVYADVEGNIGYQMPGKVPIRRSGQGWLPQPGWTGEFDWEGTIAFDELPSLYNPERGYIASANNAIINQQYPYFINQEWDYGYRAQRIQTRLAAADQFTIAEVQTIQGDNLNPMAGVVIPYLAELEFDDAEAAKWVGRLEGWNGQDQMDSAEAAVFNAVWRQLVDHLFHQTLGESPLPTSSRSFVIVTDLLSQPDSHWWDLAYTYSVEDRDQILQLSVDKALSDLRSMLGRNSQDWRWGDLHTATFRNQSLGKSGVAPIEALFNRGPYPTSGGTSIINATSWKPAEGFEVTALPSQRLIVDLSDWDSAITIHTTGQSGHAFHPNYADQIDAWRNIEFHSLPWQQSSVLSQASDSLQLIPE